mgnify:CR=1 FL=1
MMVLTKTTSYHPTVWYFLTCLKTTDKIKSSNKISEKNIGATNKTYPHKKSMEMEIIANSAIKSEYSWSIIQSNIEESDEELKLLSLENDSDVSKVNLVDRKLISIFCSRSTCS